MSLSFEEDQPLYKQLAQKLEKEIETGKWKPGDQLPSENELGNAFGVGRASVKRAVAELAKKDLVYSVQGKGTFIAKPQINNGLFRLTSFTEDMISRGIEPQNRLVQLQIMVAGPELANKLLINPEEKVIKICRLRMADQIPIILETSYLPYEICNQILDENLCNSSLYQLLWDKCGLILRNAKDTLEPVLVSKNDSDLLEVPCDSLAIKMERLTFTATEKPVEFCTALIRGDQCRFYFDLVNSLKDRWR